MFDNPKEQLKRIQQALLEEEAQERQDDLMQRVDALLEEEPSPVTRRPAAPSPEFSRNSPEEFDEAAALRPENKKKGLGGLVLLAILELAGIALVVRWWLQWL